VASLVIRIPHLPTFRPNQHGQGWSGKARADDKETAAYYVMAALQASGYHGDVWADEVALTVTMYYPTRQLRDVDNALATCKGFIDALPYTGVLPDDNCKVIKRITIECVLGSPEAPLVVLDLEAL